MKKQFIIALLGSAVLSMSACEANINAAVDPAQGSSSANASGSTDANADGSANTNASAGASVGADANVSLPGVSVGGSSNNAASGSASSSSSSTSTLNPNAALKDNSSLKIQGFSPDTDGDYDIAVTKGTKWVYSMKADIPTVSGVPTSLPPGAPAIDFGGAGGGQIDLGTLTIEVEDIKDGFAIVNTSVDVAVGAADGSSFSNTNTVKVDEFSKMFVEGTQEFESGTLTLTKSGTQESVTVPAGSYNSDVILGKLEATLETGSGVFKQDSKMWMSKGVGMVKQEATTINSGTSTTTVIELQSFSQ